MPQWVEGKISENIQNGNRKVQQGLFDEAIESYELILNDQVPLYIYLCQKKCVHH